MREMKRIIACLLVLALARPLAAHAALLFNLPDADIPMRINGKIINETETSVEIESDADGSTIVLLLDSRPYIADCVTGEAASLSDRTNDSVSAYYGPITMQSFPPQANPVVIILNVPDDFIPPSYGRAEAVEKTADAVKVTLDGGGLVVLIGRDIPISPYLTRNLVSIDNIEIGSDLLLWYPAVTLGYPAQAEARKAVILGRAGAMGIIIPVKETFAKNGVTMVPLRAAAEAIGYGVIWNGADRTVTLTKNHVSHTIRIGSDKTGDARLETSPIIADSTTYAPLSFFTDILGADCAEDDENIIITAAKLIL